MHTNTDHFTLLACDRISSINSCPQIGRLPVVLNCISHALELVAHTDAPYCISIALVHNQSDPLPFFCELTTSDLTSELFTKLLFLIF